MGCASSTPLTSTGACRHSDLDSPTALSCYIYDRGTMRHDLKQFELCFPSLVRKEEPFTHSDGRTVNILKLEGTIPIRYQGERYNIPIIIRLPEEYPRAAPIVYVNPSQDMVINKSHPYVDPSSGLVVSYDRLEHWWYYGSNLINLVKKLREDFGINPLFLRVRCPRPDVPALSRLLKKLKMQSKCLVCLVNIKISIFSMEFIT